MNYNTITISAFCAFSLVLVIACGAQSESLNSDKQLIQELMNDPLTHQINAVHLKQIDLTTYNDVDISAMGKVLKNTPNNDPCNINQDISAIKYAVEYFDNMCRHIQLVTAVKKKHPITKTLDITEWVQIFYQREPVSYEDIIRIFEARKTID